ncbi:MAG: HD domain-containing protein [Abditibacteriota bacterium]|nr:HD domain-containing protein [Abditibacteriota bacterium]
MKKDFVENLFEGSSFDDIFILSQKLIMAKKNGDPYLRMRLSDRTGTIEAVKWDTKDADLISENNYVRAAGTVQLFNSKLQATLTLIAPCSENVDPADFLQVTPKNIDSMLEELRSILDKVADEKLRKLISMFLDEEPYITYFKQCPAAKTVHQAYIGGLLEHTLAVVKICDAVTDLYPYLNKDVVLTGAFLHDIGKIDEFEWDMSIKYSDYGQMVGHIVGGVMLVRDAAKEIPDFDFVTQTVLENIILSHHEKPEYGSPKKPMSPEAVVVHMADYADSQIEIFRKIQEEDQDADDGFVTSKKIQFLNTPIFKGFKK